MNVIWWRTGETNENYSTGNQRLEPAVIAALIRCPRGLTSWFPNCLVFPKTVSHQKTSSRESKAQTRGKCRLMGCPLFGHRWLTGCSSPPTKTGPHHLHKMLLVTTEVPPPTSLRQPQGILMACSCWQIAVYSPTFLPDRNSKISEWKILSLMTGKI